MKIEGFFGEMDFATMNEADVREDIVTPLLRTLGYGIARNKIVRNHTLRHPFLKYGHREIPMRAEADYILEIDDIHRWVLEAKPPEALTEDDIHQAYSYTVHPEVNGIFFALCNGLELRLYRCHGFKAGGPPLVSFEYAELGNKLKGIENIIGPDAIRRDYSLVYVDTGEPLAAALRSRAAIVKGLISFSSEDPRLRVIDGLTMTIVGGSVFRDEKGCIACSVDTCAPIVQLQELNESLGLSSMNMSSDAQSVSTDPLNPTHLRSHKSITLPRGTRIPIMGAMEQALPYDIHCESSTAASGFLEGLRFTGSFEAIYQYSYSGQTACNRAPFVQRGPTIKLTGNFVAELR